ncbi:DgyrCDS2278 [Dimorphilus gyrociliatus]|uniref:DgyrCDS2278 n=1 Tax=Dimorphilus gyrociliatus TaxID=2664684 RepID=A0A7I8VB37_9ANNE|nr:DgyrCDS2278 [Dimorphilus gyrociliatus]
MNLRSTSLLVDLVRNKEVANLVNRCPACFAFQKLKQKGFIKHKKNDLRKLSIESHGILKSFYNDHSQKDILQSKVYARSLLFTDFKIVETLNWFCVAKKNFGPAYPKVPHQSQKQDNESDKEQPNDKMPMGSRLMMIFWLGTIFYILYKLQSSEDTNLFKFVSWNEFVREMLTKGEVDEIIVRPEVEIAFIKLHPNAVVKGRPVDQNLFAMKIADPDKFETKLRKIEAELGIKNGVSVSYQRDSSWTPLIFAVIVGAAVYLLIKNLVKVQFTIKSDFFASERKAKFVRVDLFTQQGKGISFKDVAGLSEAKLEIMEFVEYLKNPSRQELGAKIPRGALLLGPPGCGKTLLAKALASEAKVPFLAMAGSEFVEMIGGLGASRVRDLFKEARQKAPCIIYIDEIDAIGRKRSGSNWSHSAEGEHTLNQMLVEMDGMATQDGVIVLASTNRAEVLDQALLRPGRFDRHINIELPTLIERKETFQMYLRKLRLEKDVDNYSQKLAAFSPGMSGADIANICNEAALFAARNSKTAVDMEDFDYAIERVIAGMPKKSGILSVKEKKVVAYHEAGHALVGWLLKHTDALMKVTIVPRTNRALGFAQYLPKDQKLISREEIFEKMCMAMGGRVAEALIFNSVSSGAQDDLKKITDMVYTQVQQLGMSDTIGLVSFDPQAVKPYSQSLQNLIDQETRKIVAEVHCSTENILKLNIKMLKIVADALIQRETLTYNDLVNLIGPPPFGHKATLPQE